MCATCNPSQLSPANTWTPLNLALLVERLGGAIVATHSQSGIMGHHMIRILKERGHLDLVKGLITVEGGCSLPNSGLTAAEILGRTRGSVAWFAFYSLFVLAVTVHAPIGLRSVLNEWLGWRGRSRDFALLLFAAFLGWTGMRAVLGVFA